MVQLARLMLEPPTLYGTMDYGAYLAQNGARGGLWCRHKCKKSDKTRVHASDNFTFTTSLCTSDPCSVAYI